MADKPEDSGAIVDVEGLLVGHWSDHEHGTGTTVVLAPDGAVAGVDVRGSAPGTRETDLLNPINRVDRVHAIVFSGGSAFGLAAADGAVRWLSERGHGWYTPGGKVPIVPAAILYDLGFAGSSRTPGAAEGYLACESASRDERRRGTIGSGVGCTVGKMLGIERACRGGLGQAALHLPGGVVVAALAAVNAVGDIVDPLHSQIVAGARDESGTRFANALECLGEDPDNYLFRPPAPGQNTTLGLVATNARLTKPDGAKLAMMAQDGLARTIWPAHTMFDGDTVFSLATGAVESELDVSLLGSFGALVLARAVLDGVAHAHSGWGFPAGGEIVPLPLFQGSADD